MTMQTMTSGKVQTSFGEVADVVKGGEPVTITQYGRPTMLLVRYQDGKEMMREMAGKRLIDLLDERAKDFPSEVRAISDDELRVLIDEEINASINEKRT
jgi:antitoxin (DNA-binding transcriptional repressor) of toxin-antitoxin stability system